MKVIGKGTVKLFDPIDECPHEPGTEELWQESVLFYFWDTENQVYVLLRLSQEPNRDQGYTTVWLNAWTPEYIYKHTDDAIPFRDGDRTKTSLSAAGGLCRYKFDGLHNWEVADKDVKIELRMKDDHPGIGYYPENAGSLVNEANKNHIESTGWMTGSVTVKGKRYEVAGKAWRDHSWGPRNWRNIRTHRGYQCLFDDFNFFGVTFVGADGNLAKLGTVVRGDTIEAVTDFEVTAYMAEDAISNRGGRITLQLDGKQQVIEFTPVTKCIISVHQDFPCVDTMCTIKMGDLTGVGVAETSTRPQGGTETPFVFSPGILANGLHPV